MIGYVKTVNTVKSVEAFNIYKVTIENITYTFDDEKGMEVIFSNVLRKHGWVVNNQKTTDQGKRIDVLACHHSSPKDYIIFELKCLDRPKHFLTKPLKQMMDKYYNKQLTYKGIKTNLVCLITPYSLQTMWPNEEVNACIERFYWRLGFGIGNLEKMFVSFTSCCTDGYINLLYPNVFLSFENKIEKIRARQHWDD